MASMATVPAGAPSSAARFELDSPHEVARWRPLVHWLLAIPHFIIVSALGSVVGVVWLIHWVIVLITGRIQSGLYAFLVMEERYEIRTNAFFLGLTEEYPPFDFNMGPDDNGAHRPTRVTLPEAPAEPGRVAAANVLLAIPHYLLLLIIAIAVVVVAIVAWFAVLFTGRWPESLRQFVVRFENYWLRVWAYVAMVERTYPRFGL